MSDSGILTLRVRAQDAASQIATYDFAVGVGMSSVDGSGGADYLVGDASANFVLGGSGNDALIGQGGNDLLYGEDGDDVLEGGSGSDVLAGGNGNDAYILDDLLDSIDESPGGGTDEVVSQVSYTLGANLEVAA